jgi:hypothetical protein
MKIPAISGIIDRRILVNYRADKSVTQRFLPPPFRPKLVNDMALVGICLIRLKNIRPKLLPFNFGISSENGAHRIAVEWTQDNRTEQGVYIPRRDTSSRWNALAGGRIFPGAHHLAKFTVNETEDRYHVAFSSDDKTSLSIEAVEIDTWNASSIFPSLQSASDFFKHGSIGYSPDDIGKTFEGLKLAVKEWQVKPLSVLTVSSSFFENKNLFPAGSIAFDNALLMRNVGHEWTSQKNLRNKNLAGVQGKTNAIVL